MSSRRTSPSTPHKRNVALKRVDGEPLTRADIQYDVLYHIFHDTHEVFTDPYTYATPVPKISFRNLYLKTILHSPKATKALKDKMAGSEIFAEDFAMLALLVNVGRVNTTMSFFPEMKTAIRTYHPIPALQRTAGNLQDAPRIKHILKSSVLEDDHGNLPSTPADILARTKSGRVPSTTIMNLIFVLANHSTAVGHHHFPDSFDFADLFMRGDISSLSRARAFLWLSYHYLESSVTDADDDYDGDGLTNPFADGRRGNTPTFTLLSDTEIVQENVDPENEKLLAEKLVAQRVEILKSHGNSKQSKTSGVVDSVGDEEENNVPRHEESRGKRKRKAGKGKLSNNKEKAASSTTSREKVKEGRARERPRITPPVSAESGDEYFTLISKRGHKYMHNQPQPQFKSHHRVSSVTPEQPLALGRQHRRRHSPYPPSASLPSKLCTLPRPCQTRSMLQQAWHIVTTTDPLLDSDEEGGDEHLRHDYVQRLKIINSLCPKEPTSERERHLASLPAT